LIAETRWAAAFCWEVSEGYVFGQNHWQERQEITNTDGTNQYKEVEGKTYLQPLNPTAAKLANQCGVSEKSIRNSAISLIERRRSNG
jgi:hypothetical protein